MLHEFLITEGAKKLSKHEQKEINGGIKPGQMCSGSGTGGWFSEGYSQACAGKRDGTRCSINGYPAACTSNGSGRFLFY